MLAGCATEPVYSPPDASGLVAVRAYPGPTDVCQVIGENDLTGEFLGDASILVGCPNLETGAIADRLAEGGDEVAVIGEWTLISIPTG